MSERATLQKTREAAEALIHTCVSGTGSTSGGVVTGIGEIWLLFFTSTAKLVQGERGRLKIEMKTYRAMIRCTDPRRPSLRPTGCDYVCDNMLLSTSTSGIRHSRQSTLDIVVPYEVLPSMSVHNDIVSQMTRR